MKFFLSLLIIFGTSPVISANNIDLDKLFSGNQEKKSIAIDSKKVNSKESELADKKNREESIGRSGIDAVGSSIGKALREGNERAKLLAGEDYERCGSIIGNKLAYSACIKDKIALNPKAIYAIEGRCDYLGGIDNTGLSYLCSNPNRSGCSGLKASQAVINACASCDGSNLWLRVYAANQTVVRCFSSR